MTLLGCQSAPKKAAKPAESPQDVITAVGAMTEGLTNSPVTQEQLKKLAVEVEKNPEARSAVQSVNTAFGMPSAGVNYCPVCGRRYSTRVQECAVDKTKLLPVE